MSTEHTNALGAMAAGKLLAMATGGRWGPTILILAAVILIRRRMAAKAENRNAHRLALERPSRAAD